MFAMFLFPILEMRMTFYMLSVGGLRLPKVLKNVI
jgi:hypothetical protein